MSHMSVRFVELQIAGGDKILINPANVCWVQQQALHADRIAVATCDSESPTYVVGTLEEVVHKLYGKTSLNISSLIRQRDKDFGGIMTDKNIQSEGATGVFGVPDRARQEQREQLLRKAMSMHATELVAMIERVDTLQERIQRVIDMLKQAQRWTVRPETRTTLSWDRDPDGSLVDADGVDAALRVLEDEE